MPSPKTITNHKSQITNRHQRGYVLLAVLLVLVLILLATMAAAPRLAQQIRRDREQELIHRGTQYARAIKRYYKKFGRYPASIQQLEETNNLRFLRRRYKDPMTEKGEWRLIHVGEAKVVPKGFAPPGGATGGVAGATPAGGPATPGGQPGGTTPAGTPASAISTPATGPTFGGGPIVGVASTSTQRSIKELNDKDHYNDWEFVYDPRLDLTAQPQPPPAGTPGTPAQKPK